MADHDNNSATKWPGAGAIHIGSLAAGGLGLLGFSLAVFCGLAANNSVSEILTRAFVMSLVLAAIGGLAGLIASHLLAEHIQRQLANARERALELAEAAQADADGPEPDDKEKPKN